MTDRLWQIAEAKAADYAARGDVLALAITGSLPRGQAWSGSDIDLWAFMVSVGDDEDFADGMIDGVYWEIDLRPLTWLQQNANRDDWLRPPHLLHDDGVTPLEALWGCRIIKDVTGDLARVKAAADACISDAAWLKQRAGRYLDYGRGALAALEAIEPLGAIVLAREVATRYGIGAYWMQRGTLLTSVGRIPERLADHPPIYDLYRAIYSLNGTPSAEQFKRDFAQLPADVRAALEDDYTLEFLPMLAKGLHDGAVRYMRSELGYDDFDLAEVAIGLGISGDVEQDKARVLAWTVELLDLCENI